MTKEQLLESVRDLTAALCAITNHTEGYVRDFAERNFQAGVATIERATNDLPTE